MTPAFTLSAPVILQTRVKINLYLEITGRQWDGYHTLRTLFYPLPAPADFLSVAPGPAGSGLTLRCTRPELETPDNLAARAYEAWSAQAGLRPDIAVMLEKGAPMGAGLGGGSADAAAMLRLLNAHTRRPLPDEALHALAARLGADVPFFLLDTPAWAEGIGEKLTPAGVDLGGMTLLLACPDVHVNTGAAFAAWDALAEKAPDAVRAPFRFLTSEMEEGKDLCFRSGRLLFNSFEHVVFARHEELRRLKEHLLALGAAGALMSGSGASLFALFRSPATAQAAADEVGKDARVYLHRI